jgi:UDP-N-acetylmuramoyl-L-alanyl-D-glutamate--2,6-diaminopimelate ligase
MHFLRLSQLAIHFPDTFGKQVPDSEVTGIALDSRAVQPGNVFVALEGGNIDGHIFIPQAIAQGAAAVVGTKHIDDCPVPYLLVPDGRLALAQLSAAFYSFPARELFVIGVTGTDGKTTTANLIYRILKAANLQVGMITTVNAHIGDKVLDTGFHVTTPESPLVQSYLAEMVASGITHVVLEATSHGLAQKRVAACEFDMAVVTNITHEHLDYHGSYEQYQAAKGSLLRELSTTVNKKLKSPRLAVLNKADSSYQFLEQLVDNLGSGVDRVSYGFGVDADVSSQEVIARPSGLDFYVEGIDPKPIHIHSKLIGEYNISNCLAAISATALGLGISVEDIQRGILSLGGIPGRMEIINLGQDFLAIVDFAHTPNALENALRSARSLTRGNVIAVFGSAGLRDRAKRGMMAEISGKLADLTILTAEDPRSESLDSILADMATSIILLGGIEGSNFWRVPDRGDAIRFALSLAKPGDIVISCGKGHEQSMCFGEIEYAWDDRTAMQAALAELLNVDGPRMPYLPTQES